MPGLFNTVRRAVIVGWVLAAPLALAQQVTVARDAELRAAARVDAPVTAKVAQGTVGEVVAKSGAWVQFKGPEASGWLFSFDVRFASARAAGDSGAGSALGRLVGPKRDVSVTSTIGIRGLEEEDLRQAKFDAAQMKILEHYTAAPEDSANRARAAGLEPVKIDYFDAKPQ